MSQHLFLLRWSKRNQRDKYGKANHPTRQNKRQQSIRCWRFFWCFFFVWFCFFSSLYLFIRKNLVRCVHSCVSLNYFFFLLFDFPLDLHTAICKYGHELVFGNFQVWSVDFKIIVCSNRFFFLCLHFLRHLHTKSCRARISSKWMRKDKQTQQQPKNKKKTATNAQKE